MDSVASHPDVFNVPENTLEFWKDKAQRLEAALVNALATTQALLTGAPRRRRAVQESPEAVARRREQARERKERQRARDRAILELARSRPVTQRDSERDSVTTAPLSVVPPGPPSPLSLEKTSVLPLFPNEPTLKVVEGEREIARASAARDGRDERDMSRVTGLKARLDEIHRRLRGSALSWPRGERRSLEKLVDLGGDEEIVRRAELGWSGRVWPHDLKTVGDIVAHWDRLEPEPQEAPPAPCSYEGCESGLSERWTHDGERYCPDHCPSRRGEP